MTVDFRQNRNLQIVVAMVAMVLISLYEYTFTLFEKPMGAYFHWSEPAVAAVFSVYIVVESFAMMFGGRLADRYGPRWVSTVGGVLAGLGWIAASRASSLASFYVVYGLGSIGPGFVYASCIGSAVKWFPDLRKGRGLAVGLVTGGFGAGSALFIPMLAKIIHAAPAGFLAAFSTFGVVQLIGVVIVAQFMAFPPAAAQAAAEQTLAQRQFTPKTMLATRQFWILWLIFVLVVAAGQTTVAHLAAVGASFKFAAAAVIAIIALSRVFNGLGRVVIGGISDAMGRERAMAVFFGLMAVTLFASTLERHDVVLFGVLSVATLFFWGPIFTLIPAALADYFGTRNASYNYGVMSTGKAVAGLYAGLVSGLLFVAMKGWLPVLDLSAGMTFVACLLALALKSPQAATLQVGAATGD